MTVERWILIGPRASGKTTIGRELASTWNLPFIDLDELVSEKSGSSPTEWIESGRTAEFRHWECALLREWIAGGRGLLATGGGTPVVPESSAMLRAFTPVIWLRNPADQRIRYQQAAPRPRLSDGSLEDEVRRLDAERGPLYEWVSDASVDSSVGAAGVLEAFADLRARFFTTIR